MSVSKPRKPSKGDIAHARQLFADAQSDLLNFHKRILEIIAIRAWEVLGYMSFAQAWKDHFAGVTLSSDLARHVVYELLREGVDINKIATMVHGVTPQGVASLKRQMDNGVPPGEAKVQREPSKPRPKPDNTTVFVHGVKPEEQTRWDAGAAARGMTRSGFIIAAVNKACDELGL